MNEDAESVRQNDEHMRLQRFVYAMKVGTPRVWVTHALVGINAVVYLWMVLTGYSLMSETANHPFLESGANYGPRTIGYGESWRLLTAMFLHGPWYHIGLNMWILWIQGKVVERMMGNSNFAIMYLASGLVGSLASVYVNPGVPSIGASGAIFGVIGALAALLYRHRAQLPKEVRRKLVKDGGLFVIANILFGASIPNIDHAAHLGGLAAGLASGWYLAHPMTREGIARRTTRGLKLSVICAVLIVVGGSLYPTERINVSLGNEQLKPKIEAIDALRTQTRSFARELDRDRLAGTLGADGAADLIGSELLPQWEAFLGDLESSPASTPHGEELRRALVAYTACEIELWGELALDVRGRLRNPERIKTLRKECQTTEEAIVALWRRR